MALRKGSPVNKATVNTVAAMERSAARRQCPSCERKSALVTFSDDFNRGVHCRYCGYEKATPWETT